jgi:DNA-binding NtrC family response regulator
MNAKPHVLVVEDETTMLDVLVLAFRNRGWLVDAAPTAVEALAMFKRAPPDVVLTDKNLPGMTGVELIQKLRADDEHVGLMMMTAYGTVESARDTLNLGVDEYLEKPFPSLFAVVDAADALRTRVLERRAASSAHAGPEPAAAGLIVVGAVAQARRARLASLLDAADRVLWIDAVEELKPTARAERADLVILDGPSYPDDITSLAVSVRTRARTAACVVLAETLSLADVRRLIQLEVKALIEVPLESPRFPALFGAAVARVRKSRVR